MLCSENMIMNITTNDIMQNGASEGFKQSSTPTKAKAQKIQKNIRKQSSSFSSTATTKNTPKQHQKQQQLFLNKQGVSQLASPSWSDKTVNLAPQNSLPSLGSRYSISTMCNSSTYSQGSQCFANTPLLEEQSQQNYHGNTKKNIQTKVSSRSQSSSLTSEISSFDLYNECGGSSSSTNQGINNQQQLHSDQNYSYGSTLQNNTIKFSELVSPQKQNTHYQQISLNPLDNHSHLYSPKSQTYYQQNTGGQQYSQQQKNNLNNINNNYNMNNNNTYNLRNLTSSSNNQLSNWNLLPYEIQKATCDMNGQIEEVQRNFDNIVPLIEMPYNRKDAYQKVKDAQLMQEKLVFQLFNIKEGTSLKDAVDNLVQQIQNKSNPGSTGPDTKFSDNNNSTHIKVVLSKKKSSKKSSKSEKNYFENIQNSPKNIQNQAQTIQNYSQNVQTQSQNVLIQFQQGIIGNNSMTSQNNQNVQHLNKLQQNENVIHQNNYNNSYNYLPDEQDIQNKEIINNTSSQFLNNIPKSLNNHHNNQQYNHPIAHNLNNNQSIDMFSHRSLNKNSLMSPRKPTASMQGYEEDAMSQQEPMNNQLNQCDDFSYKPKLKKYMSDPFGDYYYNNNHGYLNDNSHHGLSAIYEEEDPFCNKSNNFKKDEDDTLYGAYASQNDTIEDLINSQSKNKSNQQQYYYSSENNNLSSSGYFNSAMDDEIGTSRYYNRDIVVDSFAGSSEACVNTKQRTSSVATTDLYNSQRKLDFDYGFEENNSFFNKIY